MANSFWIQIVLISLIWVGIRFFVSVLSRIEKLFIFESNSIQKEYQKWSLALFKVMSHVICICVSCESVLLSQFSEEYLYFGFSLVFIGLLLRILAIKALGRMWTYRIAVVEQHNIVNRGIYKYFRHPAYIGNVYLVGIALMFGAPASSVLAICFVLIFMAIRVPKENFIINNIAKVKNVIR